MPSQTPPQTTASGRCKARALEHSTRTRMMSITAQNTWVALPLKSPEYENPISNGVQNNVMTTKAPWQWHCPSPKHSSPSFTTAAQHTYQASIPKVPHRALRVQHVGLSYHDLVLQLQVLPLCPEDLQSQRQGDERKPSGATPSNRWTHLPQHAGGSSLPRLVHGVTCQLHTLNVFAVVTSIARPAIACTPHTLVDTFARKYDQNTGTYGWRESHGCYHPTAPPTGVLPQIHPCGQHRLCC